MAEVLKSVFGIMVNTPVWFIVAAALVGAGIGMTFLLLAILVLDKVQGRSKVVSLAKEDIAPKPVEEQPAMQQVEAQIVQQVEQPVVQGVVIGTVKKPVPPVRQTYWYYVSGVSGRFATLREALTASGATDTPADKPLDWKKLSSDVRAVIKRVRVDDEQPSTEEKPLPEDKLPEEPVPVVRRRVRTNEPEEGVIRKSIGGGAFVTFAKKKGR